MSLTLLRTLADVKQNSELYTATQSIQERFRDSKKLEPVDDAKEILRSAVSAEDFESVQKFCSSFETIFSAETLRMYVKNSLAMYSDLSLMCIKDEEPSCDFHRNMILIKNEIPKLEEGNTEQNVEINDIIYILGIAMINANESQSLDKLVISYYSKVGRPFLDINSLPSLNCLKMMTFSDFTNSVFAIFNKIVDSVGEFKRSEAGKSFEMLLSNTLDAMNLDNRDLNGEFNSGVNRIIKEIENVVRDIGEKVEYEIKKQQSVISGNSDEQESDKNESVETEESSIPEQSSDEMDKIEPVEKAESKVPEQSSDQKDDKVFKLMEKYRKISQDSR